MIPIEITLDIDRTPWGDSSNPDIAAGKDHGLGKIIALGRLLHGTTSGNSSVSVAIKMPDGKVYWAETSMILFQAAAQGFRALESVEESPDA